MAKCWQGICGHAGDIRIHTQLHRDHVRTREISGSLQTEGSPGLAEVAVVRADRRHP